MEPSIKMTTVYNVLQQCMHIMMRSYISLPNGHLAVAIVFGLRVVSSQLMLTTIQKEAVATKMLRVKFLMG